jgi:ComF family protein
MFFPGQGLRSLAFHSGPLRAAIHALKYKNSPALAETLAGLMDTHWPDLLPPKGNLVPVPLAADRTRQRGFNQSEVLARHLGQLRHLALKPDVLQRTRNTPPQVGLNASQRRQNMLDAFSADSGRVRDQDFILIDDVCTTGATLGACAKALLEGGARTVWAYTLARAPFTDADLLNQEAFV